MSVQITKMNRVRNSHELAARFEALGYNIPVSDDFSSLAEPLQLTESLKVRNRFCILPMEGWDAEGDGRPSDLVRRRWLNFAAGGAGLLWGCEAAAVVAEAKANPQQLVINKETANGIAQLLGEVRETHETHCGGPLVAGLQLTHSGRWSRPNGSFEPRTMYSHAELDNRVSSGPTSVLSDEALTQLVDTFVDRAILASDCGFDFIDFKHCHGYLTHEMLSAYHRDGPFGGSFDNRTRFTRQVLERINQRKPELEVGVRLSVYDLLPFKPGENGTGVAVPGEPRFGADNTGLQVDLREPFRFIELLRSLGVKMLCVTAGSPYYNPHIQRPALYPPSDGYQPPEDPLAGVARMLTATSEIKRAYPELKVIGTGYSYLQDYLPNVAAGLVEAGLVDAVGLGRMALSYPDMPSDVLQGRTLARKKICRTFSDCTTAPRNGLISGCYPLDGFYKKRPEAARLKLIKKSG